MSKPEEVQFEFNKPAAVMLEQAGIVKEFLVQDLAEIKAYDEEIDEDYVAGFDASIRHAMEMPIDNVVIDQQAGKGEIVMEKRKLCEEHVRDIKYFVKKAFPDNKSIRNEFGFNDYEEAKQKPAEFVIFMRQLEETVDTYKDKLRAKGMPAAKIGVAATLANELETAIKTHGTSKKGRILTTQDRRIAYNEVWNKIKLVCEAGKNVFSNNYARYRRYILYEGNQTPPPIVEEYESLPAAQTATADLEFTNDSIVLFKNPGVTDLLICRHNKENEPNGEIGFILTSNAEVVKDILDVPGAGNFINITNLSETDSGLFLVQLAE
jgi:hypothetical protein